ncbi:phage gp6-like head-tail connector protein [Sinorhizobium medicae]|nr:phage gp6-like head-tail connector protein [Sinorhizobium medicae]
MNDLSLLKTYLRIDGSEEDNILALFVSSAKEFLSNAGVKELLVSDQSLYELAIMLFVKKEYARDEKEVDLISKSLNSIILQLKA